MLSSAGLGDDRVLPMRLVSSACRAMLLILWLPVWLRSSRLSRTSATPKALARPAAGVNGVGRPLYSCSRVSSSAWKASSTQALRNASSSSSRAATSASGTNRPPLPPEMPTSVGQIHSYLLVGVADRWMSPAETRSWTAAPGSAWVTRASPTSTASAPEAAYANRSCGERTPDSATRRTPSRMVGATCEDAQIHLEGCEGRALTPDDLYPASTARTTSSASWTSTSGSNLIDSASTKDERGLFQGCHDQQGEVCTVGAPSHSWWEVTMKSLHQNRDVHRCAHRSQVLGLPQATVLSQDADATHHRLREPAQGCAGSSMVTRTCSVRNV